MRKYIPELAGIDPKILTRIEIEATYAHHVRRQAQTVSAFLKDESLELGQDFDYGAVAGLSFEMRERLIKVRPSTFVSDLL